MKEGKDVMKTAGIVLEMACIATLTGIALWRNDVAYRAELKAIDMKAERDVLKGLTEIQQLEIDYLQKKLSKKEEES